MQPFAETQSRNKKASRAPRQLRVLWRGGSRARGSRGFCGAAEAERRGSRAPRKRPAAAVSAIFWRKFCNFHQFFAHIIEIFTNFAV